MEQRTILVVDDSPQNLAVLADALHPHFRVLAATSGERALDLATREPRPDLMLLDVMMPGMTGYEVLARLRADRSTAEIPVMFVTGMDASEDEQTGLGLGAVDYITKPIRPGVVLARIRMQLELRDARDRLAAQNSYLESEVARRMRDNQLIQDVSIHALARLAETRDPETGNHLRRTQKYVELLALRLRPHPRFASFLTDRAIELVVKSAPLHDIGKVGIPDHILLKPGPLTPDEWEVMKQHPVMGAHAIELAEEDAEHPVEFLIHAKRIARHHHERWDGRGYPDRLAGEVIPIPARLMALADAFDALTTSRIYKRSVSPQDARTQIARDRAKHFDPDVVDAFLAGFDDFCEVAESLRDADAARRAAESAMGR